jgi:hypothetical protein
MYRLRSTWLARTSLATRLFAAIAMMAIALLAEAPCDASGLRARPKGN